ncbi:hypothetical protein K8M07_05220 [Schnuerera sp. xch1]|nr:CD1871A family CXXC motif-containing protein [Schnuerera sp. xch1]MBZ2174645.1 hypothetical protein [Schnuerera sp. xch1]
MNLTQNKLRCGILLLSIVFVVAGVYLGEVHTILNKATNICLECIGIG